MSEEKNLFEKDEYIVEEETPTSEVKIADDVVAVIAGLAATEVEGVSSIAGNITNELINKLGGKHLSRGVKVRVENGEVAVELALLMKYGYSIPKVTAQVVERVKAAIENMTGLSVISVDIRISGVDVQ